MEGVWSCRLELRMPELNAFSNEAGDRKLQRDVLPMRAPFALILVGSALGVLAETPQPLAAWMKERKGSAGLRAAEGTPALIHQPVVPGTYRATSGFPAVDSLDHTVEVDGCCVDLPDELGFCPHSSFCDSDCYRHWFKNGSSTCIRCVNGTSTHSSTNQTECINLRFSSEGKASNGTTVSPTILKIGGPEIAASVCLGTLVIGLLFILSVAAFFYLKRSNKLPYLFYQQGKDSILQPSEMAGMMRSSVRSVRKQRYSRRDRLSASVASSAAVSDV